MTRNMKSEDAPRNFDLRNQDNNPTAAKRNTELMKEFHSGSSFCCGSQARSIDLTAPLEVGRASSTKIICNFTMAQTGPFCRMFPIRGTGSRKSYLN